MLRAGKGHLPTISFTLTGSSSIVLFSTKIVLDFFAAELSDSKVTVTDATQKLKVITKEGFEKFVQFMKDKDERAAVYFGTCGPNDVLYAPTGWLPVQLTGDSDVLGLKLRLALYPLTFWMAKLVDKLKAHESPSNLLESFVASLKEARGGRNASPVDSK